MQKADESNNKVDLLSRSIQGLHLVQLMALRMLEKYIIKMNDAAYF